MTKHDFTPTNINLHRDDVEWLRRHYSRGWAKYVRAWVREGVKEQQYQEQKRLCAESWGLKP